MFCRRKNLYFSDCKASASHSLLSIWRSLTGEQRRNRANQAWHIQVWPLGIPISSKMPFLAISTFFPEFPRRNTGIPPCNIGIHDTFYSSNAWLSRTYVRCAEFSNMKTYVRKSKASLPLVEMWYFHVGLNFYITFSRTSWFPSKSSLDYCLLNKNRGWTNASVFKSTYCFSRGLEFISQHPLEAPFYHLLRQHPGDPMTLVSARTYAYVHISTNRPTEY